MPSPLPSIQTLVAVKSAFLFLTCGNSSPSTPSAAPYIGEESISAPP